MKRQKLWVAGILMAVLLALVCGARAETPLGVQKGASYKSIALNDSSNAATVLDYLEDYLNTEVTTRLTQAEILTEYVDNIEANKDALYSLNDDQITQWLAIYDSKPANGLMTPKELTVESYRQLVDTRNEIDFFVTKLTEMISKDEALRSQILCGGYTPLEIDQLRSELEIVDREAEKYRVGALKKLTGERKLTAAPRQAATELSVFNEKNPNRQALLAIEGLNEFLVRREAKQISLRENQDEELPHITVVSDNNVGVQLLEDAGGFDDAGLPITHGIGGMEVTLTLESGTIGVPDPSRQQTKVTDNDGIALFDLADFEPKEGKQIEVYMTIRDPEKRYQRKDYGFCHFQGGDLLKMYPEKDTGEPYLVSLKFEDLDMTVMDEGMFATKDNTKKYSINGEVEMNGCTNQQFHVQLVDTGATTENGENELTLIDKVIKPGGATTFSVQSAWLNRDAPEGSLVLRGGHQLVLRTSVEALNGNGQANKTSEWFPSWRNLSSSEYDDFLASIDDSAPSKTYLDNFVGGVGIKLPSGIPIVGGSEISIADLTELPMFKPAPGKDSKLSNVKIQVDLPRSITIAYNGKLKDPSKDDEGRIYATEGTRAVEQRHKEDAQNSKNTTSMLDQGIEDMMTIRANGKWANTFSFALSPYIMIKGTVVNKDDFFTISADIDAGLIFDICLDVTFYPIPMFYGNLNALFRLKCGWDLGAEFDLNHDGGSRDHVEFSGASGFNIYCHIEFTLSAGVGIKGVASFGIRGAFWVDLYGHWTPKGANGDVVVGARVEMFLEMFFFKWSSVIIEWTNQPEDELILPSGGEITAESLSAQLGREIPRDSLKVIQTKHATLAFWINHNNPDGQDTLEMATIDSVEGLKYRYPDQTIFTTDKERYKEKYIYDYDVVYDDNYHVPTLGERAPREGIYIIVSAGDWEDGVVIGGGETDYWKQDARNEIDAVYKELYKHKGSAYFCEFQLLPSEYQDRQPYPVQVARQNIYSHQEILVNPSVELVSYVNKERYGDRDYPYRTSCAVMAGIVFLESGRYCVKEFTCDYAFISYNDISMLHFTWETAGFFDLDNGEELPDYWILNDGVYVDDGAIDTEGSLEVLQGWHPILVQRRQNDLSTLQMCWTSLDVIEIYSGKQTINALSKPIYSYTYKEKYGFHVISDKSLRFFLSDGEPVEGKADQNMPGNTNSISVLCFELPDCISYGIGDYRIYDYDLPGSGGNVNTLYVPWQNATYFYWFATRPDGEHSTDGRLDVMACLLDTERDVVSPAFRLAEMAPCEGDGMGLFCLQNDRQTETVLEGVYYTDRSGLVTSNVELKAIPTLDAFAPDVAAVGYCEDFNIYARIENTGAFVLQEVKYDLSAWKEGTTEDIPIKTITIDLREPNMSSVTHLDYLRQDHPELQNMSADELTDALNRMNDADEYTTVGEHAVYRVPDNYDYFNGNLLRTVTTTQEDGEPSLKAEVVENYFFMPGNKATYKSHIDGYAMHRLSGKYYLSMTLSRARFSFAMDDEAPVYEAVLRRDGSRYDFYRLDENGDRVVPKNGEEDGTLAWFNGDLPQKPVETSWLVDNNGLNTARNDALTVGNMRYLTMEQNDFDLSAREYNLHGVDYVDLTLRNNAPEIAPDITPRLIAKTLYQGVETPTGWSATFKASNIKGDFSRAVTVPVSEIVNGRKFEEIRVYLVTNKSEDPADFMDQNNYNNKVTLSVTAPFRILRQPQSVTVPENTDATFNVLVEGGENCRYQWVVRRPDGVERQLDGENSATLVVRSAQLYQSGYSLACYVTAPDGRTIRSDYAKLTVALAPPTGDSENPYLFAIASAMCLAAIFMLLKKRRSAKN